MFHVPHDSDPRNGNRLVGTAPYREIKLNCESETRNDRLFLDTSDVSYMVFSHFLEAYFVNIICMELSETLLICLFRVYSLLMNWAFLQLYIGKMDDFMPTTTSTQRTQASCDNWYLDDPRKTRPLGHKNKIQKITFAAWRELKKGLK